jgi:hypothetical protein
MFDVAMSTSGGIHMRTVISVLVAAVVIAGCSGTPSSSNGVGGPATPAPALTSAPAPIATPAHTPVAPGIPAWTTYTSAVYGITFGYPEDWHLESAATRTWQAGDPFDFGPFSDTFASPDGDDQVGLWVFRVAAGSGADIESLEGLAAFVCELEASACQTISDGAEPMCLGRVACLPAVLARFPEGVLAYFADTETRMVTVVQIGRGDSFPGAARYGGSVQLLKSILTTMDVWTLEPGQIPAGT